MYEYTFGYAPKWCKQKRRAWFTSNLMWYTEILKFIRDWHLNLSRVHFKYVSVIRKALKLILWLVMYRAIHKSLWDFRPLRYRSQDGHAEGKHVNRGRDTPSFCPNLQVLDMSALRDAADVNPVIKSCNTRCNIWRLIAATASTILRRSCGKSRGIGGTYMLPMPRDLPCVAGT
jgi:hypothetical protein